MPARLSSMELSDAAPLSEDAPASLSSAGPEHAQTVRKSARVVKKPELFAPEPSIVQNGDATRGKRKRATLDENGGEILHASEGSSDNDRDDATDSDEGEPDDEEIRAKKKSAAARRAKSKGHNARSAKKPKTTNPRRNALPVRSALKQRRTRLDETEGVDVPGDLFDHVFSQGHTTNAVAAEWLSRYERNNSEAMRDLVNFVLKAAGCQLEVTVTDIEDQDNVTGRLADLQDEYQASNIVDYPLIARSKGQPPFRPTLVAFISSLVSSLHESDILYTDLALIENLQIWVTTMTSSAVRPFRHTATLISLALVSQLCEVGTEVFESNAKTRRQLEDEKKKARSNKSRLATMQEKVDSGDRKWEVIEGTLQDIYDTVFVNRYRDVDPRIRSDCVHALGHWILTLPDVFFDEQYLRYLGWILFDPSASTRLEVIKQLQRLFKNQDNVAGLQSFTEKFRSRLVEMAARDSEANIRAGAVDLLDSIRATGLLEPDDINEIGALIFDSEPRVRKAVAGFFAANVDDLYESRVESLGGDEAVDEVLPVGENEDYDSPRSSWLKIKCVVELLQTYDSISSRTFQTPPNLINLPSDGETRFSLAAHAIFDKIPEVQEWEALGGYLLYDHSVPAKRRKNLSADDTIKAACRLSESEEIAMLQILHVSIKTREEGDKGRKKKVTKGELHETQESTARHLAQLLPRLLNKFGAVPAAASVVLRLEHLLDLEVFQELRQDETTFSALLDDINKQFLSHANQSVLAEASSALLHARSFEELEDVTDEKVRALWDETVGALCTLAAGKQLSKSGNLSATVLTSLSNAIRRISNLASVSDCTKFLESAPGGKKGSTAGQEPLRLLLAAIQRGVSLPGEINSQLEDEVVSGALRSVLFYFFWKAKLLRERAAKTEQITPREIASLKSCRDAFASVLTSVIRTRTGLDAVRLAAAGTFLDLSTLFATFRQTASPSSDASGNLQSLTQEISAEHSALISSVFVAAEKAYARKARKPLDVGEDDEPLDDESDDESDGDEDDAAERERLDAVLVIEQSLCEFTSKIVLAIIGRVLDNSEPTRGALRARILRNRGKLGLNYKEVVAYLDEQKVKKKAKNPAATAPAKQNVPQSDHEDIEDEGAPSLIEEGGEDDLRDRELVMADADAESGRDDEEAADEVEDEVMGD
ncbi:MAG: hypothetical protein M1825_003294 [Sarcosagium campestre]|nr:MAG: hypothetical protein M1825_003294 [Sarcosagium campestre]